MHTRRTALPILMVLGIFFLWIVNTLAMKYSWYIIIPWFDMPMHYLGGVWAGMLSLFFTITYVLPRYPMTSRARRALLVMMCVLSIGLGWELFEFLLGRMTYINFGDFADTMSDLFFDTIGGGSALFLFYGLLVHSPARPKEEFI